jgi:DNA-binding beta-propeller fold protein YncE
VLLAATASRPLADEILYVTEGNNLRRLDVSPSTGGPVDAPIFIQHAERGAGAGHRDERDDRRDINGMVCALADGQARYIAGEDTGQPHPGPGWGVFDAAGRQVGKLTPTFGVVQAEPHGCVIGPKGRLFTSDVGNVGFGTPRGQLIVWFPPFEHFPGPPGAYPDTDATSTNYCKLATDIGTAGGVAIDAEGRVYVASAGRGAIYRFSPPFPTGPAAEQGCGAKDEFGSPLATDVLRETFFSGLYSFSGLAFASNGHLYASSVFTGEIIELDPNGELVRKLLEPHDMLPPFETGNPMGIAVDRQGRIYYADLDLVWDFPSVAPGEDGKVRRIDFDTEGAPLPPEILIRGLGFPDGVSVLEARP